MKKFKFVAAGLFAGVVLATAACEKDTPPVVESPPAIAPNSVALTLNGQEIVADNLIYNDRTYVELNDIAAVLGFALEWDGTTRTININSNPLPTIEVPLVDKNEYIGRTGLEVYKTLKELGYEVLASFENDLLTQMNGNAGLLFEKTDIADLASVDAFVVGNLIQNEQVILLTIIHQPVFY